MCAGKNNNDANSIGMVMVLVDERNRAQVGVNIQVIRQGLIQKIIHLEFA